MKQFLALAFSLATLFGFTQNYEIKGKITDSSSNDIIPLVNIFVDSQFVATAEIDGSFQFTTTSGDHILEFDVVGYEKQKQIISGQKNQNLSISLEKENQLVDVVVVSASRIKQKISDVTVSMDVIKPDLIENNNTNSLEQFIEQSSGVAIINGQANIRGGGGFSYGAGSRVLVLIDDVPVIRPGVGDVMWDYLPTEDIEQIEVLKGASSALYGASALNGVINIRTARAKDKPLTKVRLYNGWYDDPNGDDKDWYDESSNHPTYSGVSFYHLRRIKTHDFALSGNAVNDDGFLSGGPSQKIRLSMRSIFRPKWAKGLTFGINGNAQYSDEGQFLMWNDDTTGFYQPLNGRVGRLTYRQYSLDPHLTHQTKNGKFSYRGKYFLVDSAALVYTELQYQRNIRLWKKNNLVLTGGIVNGYSDVHVEELGKHKSNEMSYYLQSDFDFDRIKISLGARHQTYSLDSDSLVDATVLRAGINYRIRKGTNLRASYGQGFRYPSMAEKFIRFSANPLEIYPNEELNPEQGESAELAIKQAYRVGKNYTGFVDVAVFWSQFREMMEFKFGLWGDPFNDNFFGLGFKSDNASLARIRGVEITHGSDLKIGEFENHLTLGYTYIYPEDRSVDVNDTAYQDKDEYLRYRIPHLGKASWQSHYKKFTAGLNIRCYSFMQNIDDIFLADHPGTGNPIVPGLARYREENQDMDWVWDFNIGYKATKNSTFQLIIKNMANNAYTIRPALPEAPRSVVLQYSGTF